MQMLRVRPFPRISQMVIVQGKRAKRSKRKLFKPGERVPVSGQYQLVHPDGELGPERTVVKGEPFPPPIRPGMRYVLVDPTKH